MNLSRVETPNQWETLMAQKFPNGWRPEHEELGFGLCGIETFMTSNHDSLKLEAQEILIEKIAVDTVIVSYYYNENGNSGIHFSVQVQFDFSSKTANVITLQNEISLLRIYATSTGKLDETLQKNLNSFVSLWLRNLKSGFYK